MTENLNQTIIQLVQKELSDYRPKQLTTVLNLLNEGNDYFEAIVSEQKSHIK